MVFLVGLQIFRLAGILDLSHQSFKKPYPDQLAEAQKPINRKIYVGSRNDFPGYSQVVGVDLEKQFGLEKTKGLKTQVVRQIGEGILVANEKVGSQVIDLMGRTSNPPTLLERRQEVLFALENHFTVGDKFPTKGTDVFLFRFADAFWSKLNPHNTTEMDPSWEICIDRRSYFSGIGLSQRSLASEFTFACVEASDTSEIQIILAKAMIEKDPTNPIAWWYLGRLNNTSFSVLIELDWKKQLKAIEQRMGTWQIGKDYLTKRFQDSH